MKINKVLFLSIALLSTGLMQAKKIEPKSLQEQTIQVLAKNIALGTIKREDARKALPRELWARLDEVLKRLDEETHTFASELMKREAFRFERPDLGEPLDM